MSMIDLDLRDFGQAITALRTDPTNKLFRQEVHRTSRLVFYSTMTTERLYVGVIETVVSVDGKTRAQLVKEGFEEALELMSSIDDDYLRAVKSRWDDLEWRIKPATCHTA